MKIIVYLIISALIVVLAFFPFLNLTPNLAYKISLSTQIISAIASILTLIIALFLFDKYGLKTTYKNKQLKTVLAQKEKIGIVELLVKYEINDSSTTIPYAPYNKNALLYLDGQTGLEDQTGKIVAFEQSYYFSLYKIFKYINSPYLPKPIKNSINEVMNNKIVLLEEGKYEKSKFIFLHSEMENENYRTMTGKNNFNYFTYSDKALTFNEFHQNWIKINTEILNWLENNDIKID